MWVGGIAGMRQSVGADGEGFILLCGWMDGGEGEKRRHATRIRARDIGTGSGR